MILDVAKFLIKLFYTLNARMLHKYTDVKYVGWQVLRFTAYTESINSELYATLGKQLYTHSIRDGVLTEKPKDCSKSKHKSQTVHTTGHHVALELSSRRTQAR
jgi:hypothetical protein